MFDYHLLRGFGTDLGESYINGKLKTGRNITRWSFFKKLRTVAMVMEQELCKVLSVLPFGDDILTT